MAMEALNVRSNGNLGTVNPIVMSDLISKISLEVHYGSIPFHCFTLIFLNC